MRPKMTNLAVMAALLAPLAPAHAERIIGLTTGNTIVTFDSATPGVTKSSGSIAGIAAGDTLTGLDLRPATRTLYSVGSSGTVYSITKNASGRDYTATSVGMTSPSPTGSAFGVDFNPVPDRIRFIGNDGQNLRINPTNGATIVDGTITLNGSTNVALIGAAYTNSRPGALTTTLYGFDAISDSLVRSTNPNGGTFVSLNAAGVPFGGLGFDIPITGQFGFDISGGSGLAFANSLDVFGTIDLNTGAGTIVGTIGAGSLSGLTAGAVPEPASWALLIGGFGLVGVAMRRRGAAAVAA